MARILILQGHPSGQGGHLCHALADSYATAALAAGHEVRRLDAALAGLPPLRDKAAWDRGPAPEGVAAAQEAIAWAGHLVILFPLWLGAMPATLKGFLEQVLRPGFAFQAGEGGAAKGWRPALGGRSARIVVTMGMPALAYRWWYGAFALRSLERNILHFVGIRPCRHTLIGMVEGAPERRRGGWFRTMEALGRAGR